MSEVGTQVVCLLGFCRMVRDGHIRRVHALVSWVGFLLVMAGDQWCVEVTGCCLNVSDFCSLFRCGQVLGELGCVEVTGCLNVSDFCSLFRCGQVLGELGCE